MPKTINGYVNADGYGPMSMRKLMGLAGVEFYEFQGELMAKHPSQGLLPFPIGYKMLDCWKDGKVNNG